MNRLAGERSPYLLQHASNPVDWHPWGEEAFARARAEDKPIFLSIGYSTCHWCHVMARESFEDPAAAALLNEHFVAIKVDREERPDVDHVYMSYVQAVTGHGGWPLSAWLTPKLEPFYGGTYFPPEDRPGRAAFSSILRAVVRAWRDERAKLLEEGARVVAALKSEEAPPPALPGLDLEAARAQAFARGLRFFRESFDPVRGGFGGAPKFPRAAGLAFLFRCAADSRLEPAARRDASAMAALTLRQMARGGIHDHVGGGFHRYSVDEDWFVPHFEKMLYDQAQIALNALEAWQATADERHAWLARDVLEYVLRDLTSPQGGFYSAEDADSEPADVAEVADLGPASTRPATASPGHELVEGAFYVWSKPEIEAALSAAEAALVCAHFGVAEGGNVPPARDPQGEFRGKNILAQARPLAETARALGLPPQEASDRLGAALEGLRAARARRPRPLRDDKVLAGWNGLMISALARAASLPAESLADRRIAYLRAATAAAEFAERELYDAGRGALHRVWRGGRGPTEGFAEDYAFLVQGLLDLYEAGFDPRWARWAVRLQERMDALFWDGAGYANSPAGDPHVIVRLKEDYDGAAPAPSSVAAANLLRLEGLAALTGVEASGGLPFRQRALRILEAFHARWLESPQGLPQMLCALDPALAPPRRVVIAGDPASAGFRALADAFHAGLGPRRALLAATGSDADAPAWLAALRPVGGRAAAYLCEDFACRPPETDPAALRALL